MIRYVLCGPNRTGSTFLADILSRLRLGNAYSYYFPLIFQERLRIWSQHWQEQQAAYGVTPHAVNTGQHYYDEIWHMQSVQNAAGLKLGYSQLQQLLRELPAAELPADWIYLTRRDKLRQAISYYRASITKRWSSADTASATEPEYDYSTLVGWQLQLLDEEAKWEEWLQNRRVLRLYYEDLDTPETVAAVLRFLQLKLTNYVPQRDALTDEWVLRFQQQTRQIQ